MTADDLLAELGARMGLAQAVFDNNRACRLTFDGSLNVDLEAPENARTLNLFGVVGPILPGRSADFYEHLLESNLPADGEPGPAIGMDPASRELVLLKSFPIEHATLDQLVAGLEQLLSEMETWKAWLESSGHEEPAVTSAEGDEAASFISV